MESKSSSARRQSKIGALCRYLFPAKILAISISTAIFAQSEVKISGRVIDSVSGVPVAGAVIAIDNLGKSAVSEFDGAFLFKDIPVGDYILSAGRIGYEQSGKIEISVDSYLAAHVSIELLPLPLQVEGQVVSGSRGDPVQITRKGNITTIEIGEAGSFSMDDLQSRLPELEIVDSGAEKYLRIRGSDPNATEVRLNGRKINSILTAKGDISVIPFGSVSRIEIVRGGDHKSRGLAGSVNFITSDPEDDLEIETAAERGSFGREAYSLRLSGLNFIGTGISVDTENIFDRGDFTFIDPRDSIQTRVNNHHHDRKLFGAVNRGLGRTNLELTARLFQRSAGSPGQVFQITPEASSDILETEFALEVFRKLNRDSGLILTGGTTQRELKYDSPRTVYNFIPYNNTFNEVSRDIIAIYQYSGRIDFDISGEIRYESLEGEDHIRPAAGFGLHSRSLNSIQGGLVYRLPPPPFINILTTITPGIRREGGFGGDFHAPSIALRSVFDIFARPGFDISYSRSRRLPDMTDLFWKEDVFAEPNPDLKSEVSGGYEIGLDFEFEAPLSSKLRIARHHREYDDLIIWRRWAGNRFKPVNLSKAEIGGWEVSFESEPFTGPISLFWTASFSRPLNKEAEINHYNKYLTFRPVGTQTAVVQFRKYGLDIRLSGRHLGRRYQTEENTKSLPPVDLLDLRLGFSLNVSRLDISTGFEMLNLGDRQYEVLDRQPERPREYRVSISIQENGGLL